MSGNSVISDTNTLIYLLDDTQTYSTSAEQKLDGKQVWISVITELEQFGKKGLRQNELKAIEKLVNSCFVVDLNTNIKNITKQLMQSVKIKLPDAIIASTSLYLNFPLVTADTGFQNIPQLDLLFLEENDSSK